MQFLIILVVLFAVMWLFVLRPQRRRQQEQQRQVDAVAPGAEILTAGGLYGTVREIGEDEIKLEIAPGTTVRVARRAIAAVIGPDDDELDEIEQAQRQAEEEVLVGRDDGKQ